MPFLSRPSRSTMFRLFAFAHLFLLCVATGICLTNVKAGNVTLDTSCIELLFGHCTEAITDIASKVANSGIMKHTSFISNATCDAYGPRGRSPFSNLFYDCDYISNLSFQNIDDFGILFFGLFVRIVVPCGSYCHSLGACGDTQGTCWISNQFSCTFVDQFAPEIFTWFNGSCADYFFLPFRFHVLSPRCWIYWFVVMIFALFNWLLWEGPATMSCQGLTRKSSSTMATSAPRSEISSVTLAPAMRMKPHL